jgi:hypothetical protein
MSLLVSPPRPLVAPVAESRPAAQRWPPGPLLDLDPAQPALDLRPAAARATPGPFAASDDHSAAGLPDARSWSVALAVTLLEVVTARRPGAQLSRWLAEDTLETLTLRLPARRAPAPPGGPAPGLQSVRVQHPREGVAEVSVHGRLGSRSVVMALRLEARRGRWLCTALELGPLP